MPNTRNVSGKNGKQPQKRGAKAASEKPSVVKDTNMAENKNSNHLVSESPKRVRLNSVVVVRNKFKQNKSPAKRQTRVLSGQKSDGRYDLEANDNEIETHQFKEDGELIQMEINDGGAAAAEFASESSASESDSDEELDQNPSRDEQTEDTEAQTSDGDSDSEM